MKKAILALLSFSIAVGVLAACSSNKNNKGNNTTDSNVDNISGDTSASPVTTDDPLYADPKLESYDFGGRDFVFVERDHGTTYIEFDITEDSSNKVDSAVYKRNQKINEKYSTQIVSVRLAMDQIVPYAEQQITSGNVDFDVIVDGYIYQMQLASHGNIYDVNKIPHIDTEKHYWMQSILADSSIANKNYFLTSYANLWSLNSVGVLFFNTELINDLKFESPYDLVDNNEWTYDKMFAMSKAAYKDNGDGTVSLDDLFGTVSTNAVNECMFSGLNGQFITKDNDDIPQLNITDSKTIDVITKIIEYWADDSSLHINRYSSYQSPNKNGNLLTDTMLDGRAVFMPELLYQLTSFADASFIIGMVPLPKYDETQEYYWSYVHQTHGSAFSVPIVIGDDQLNEIGMVLEDIAYISYNDIRPVFYDENLKIRRAQDDKSAEMLDLIFSHIRVDLGNILQFTGIKPNIVLRNATFNKDTSIVGELNSYQSQYQTILDELLAKLP